MRSLSSTSLLPAEPRPYTSPPSGTLTVAHCLLTTSIRCSRSYGPDRTCKWGVFEDENPHCTSLSPQPQRKYNSIKESCRLDRLSELCFTMRIFNLNRCGRRRYVVVVDVYYFVPTAWRQAVNDQSFSSLRRSRPFVDGFGP